MADPRKLKAAVQKAVEGGKHKKASQLYLELAEAESAEGLWPHRAGELLKKLGDNAGAVDALREAAGRYSHRGFLLKAIAVCKMILDVDPEQTETQELLARLYADPQAAPIRPAPPKPTIPPGKGLEAAALETVVEDVKQGPGEGIFEVPLEEEIVEVEAEEEVEVEEVVEAPTEESGRAAMQDLPSTPLFSSLDEDSLRRLIQAVQMLAAPAGFPVTTGGEEADSLYVIVSGKVAIRHEGRETEELLFEGDFFGEGGLLDGVPRPAVAVAVDDSDVMEIPRSVIVEIIDRRPDFLKVILRLVRERLLSHLLRSSPLFADYSEEDRHAISQRFRFVEVRPDTLLIREGEQTLGLCLMMAGHAEVLSEGEGMLATLGPGDIFGEMSLLSQGPAVASIRSTTKCWVLLLAREDFDELVVASPRALEFVTALAEERRRINAAIAAGQISVEEARLPLS